MTLSTGQYMKVYNNFLKYAKSIKLETIKEMMTGLCPQLDFVGFDAVEESRNFQVGFAEISKRVKIAAGIIYI